MPIDLPIWPPAWPAIEAAALATIRSGDWGSYRSAACQRLRSELAEAFAAEHARLCCSGTAAVELALRAAGVGPGDEVILAAYDYPGNFRCVELLGARPVLVDLAPESPTLAPDHLPEAASENVKAVIASHLFGQAADVARIRHHCDQRGWIFVEDACQTPGMLIDGRPAGSFGHLATLSFGGSKPLTAGSGGALLTSDRRMAARLGPLLERPSDAFPLGPLQAAVVSPQLKRLDRMNEQRRDTARFLAAELSGQTPQWQLLARDSAGVAPAFYKLAWCARSAEQRVRVVERASELGLPIGPGFRSSHRASRRRCRQPLPLERSRRLGDTLFVLDQTALLVAEPQRRELAALLQQLHDETSRLDDEISP